MGRRILACTSLAVMSIAVAGGLIGSCISDRIADENCKHYGKDDFGGNLEDAYEISAPILTSKYLPYQNIYESLADGHEIRVCGQINKDKMDYAIEEYLDNHPDVVKTTIQQS
jgi:hypothetical protein